MGWFRRKPQCEHEWYKVSDKKVALYQGSGDFRDIQMVGIYCPKCDTRDAVNVAEWQSRQRIQEIRKEWRINERRMN